MQSYNTKIVVIHDDIDYNPASLVQSSPIMVKLAMKYDSRNVLLFKHSQEGLNFVLQNLGQKMVVLLDKNFYDGKEKSGIKVFNEIRERTALVYVILTTVSKLTDLDDDDLKSLINNELFAFERFSSDYSTIIELIDKAVQNLELRIDAVIEDWIMRHPEDWRTQPLLKTKDGKSYSMNEILSEIRLQTKVGIDFQKNLLKLAIDLFGRQKLKVND